MDSNEKEGPPRPPGGNQYDTVGQKSFEAQNYGNPTADGSQHNYQTSNATDPSQFAELNEEKRARFIKPSGETPSGEGKNDAEGNQTESGSEGYDFGG